MKGTFLNLTTVQWYGVIAILIGTTVCYFLFHRRFKRSNFAGKQTFSNSFAAWTIPKIEWVFNLLAWVMILAGAFLILIEIYTRS